MGSFWREMAERWLDAGADANQTVSTAAVPEAASGFSRPGSYGRRTLHSHSDRVAGTRRYASARICASTTAMADMLTMSRTSSLGSKMCTGRDIPISTGPIASAPPRRCIS